ncbi:MAG: hypothetical protein M3320_04010 [Actinomycetota bacterium]|nr:hypothetical protein [Actinomycetota bacterium]
MDEERARSPDDVDIADRLTRRERTTLRSLLSEAGRPDLVVLVDVLETRLLTDRELEELESTLLSVFTASLDAEDEPTPRGAEADSLIGRLQPYGEQWHRSP